MDKRKIFIVTTIPASLNFFKGNLHYLSHTFEVCAISSKKEQLERVAQKEGIHYYCIPMKREISLFVDLWCLLRFIFFFLKERPDIVHGNTPKGSMLSMVAAWITRVPVRIYMCHGLRYQGAQGKMRKLLMFMEKISCFCASTVMCVSNGVRETLVSDGICRKEKAIVVGSGSAAGVDLEYFSPDRKMNTEALRQQLNIKNEDFVFIFIGRIVSNKGINELVSAFSRLYVANKNIHLLLVGPEENDLDPILSETKSLIDKIPNIHAVGSQNDVRPYLKISDIMTFPSYREGFGMVLIEAGAMGIPAISSNITGCNEIIQDGYNGMLIESKNEESLYLSMKWSYEHRSSDVLQMKEHCREMVAKRYENKKVWETYLKEYNKLIDNI